MTGLTEVGGARDRGRLATLGRLAARRPKAIALVGIVTFVLAAIAAVTVLDATRPYDFRDPETESVEGADRYAELTGVSPAPEVAVVVDADDRADAAGLLAKQRGIGEVAAGTPPQLAADGDALLLGYLERRVADPAEVGERVVDAFRGRAGAIPGGPAVAAYEINEQTKEDMRRVEAIAIPILFLLCLWVFRGVVAALLPIVVGAFSITISLGLLRLVAELTAIDVFSINVLVGLGLGLAIDYSLFVLSRFREEGGVGADDPAPALATTLATAGRTVLFSATIVVLALLTLFLFPQRFLYSIAIAGAIVAAVSALAAVTVLPAILRLLGTRVDSLAVGRRGRESRVAGRGPWYRLARGTTARRVPVTAVTVLVLVVASLPATGIDLTSADAGGLPADRYSRQLDDRLARAPAGTTEPIVVLGEAAPPDAVAEVVTAIEALPGVKDVRGVPLPGDSRRFDIVYADDALAPATQSLVQDVREIDGAARLAVSGRTAELVDARSSIEGRIPLAIGLLVATTFLALFAMTRSVVLPALMTIFNLLSIGAAFGIVTLVYDQGALGLADAGAIDISIPVLFFAIAFGLSTDYGVFVLARIKEARDAGAENDDAIETGLSATGRIVTAAALLFGVAIGGFIGSELVLLRQFALGLAAAVLIDASLIRLLLMPATLSWLGDRAWWGPRRRGSGPAN